MSFQSMLAGIGISLFFLMPLSIKWQIQLKRSLAGAVVIGLAAGIITGAISGLFGGLSTTTHFILTFFLVLGLASSSVALMFYRDPERRAPERTGVMVSPADGSVIYVKKIEQGKVPLSIKKGRKFRLDELTQTDLLRDGGHLIGIGMNLLNVHVNRAPIEGRVETIKHITGDFISLKRPEAVLLNERLTTVIDDGQFKVAVVQIASRLVRRIDTYLDEGQFVEKGQRIGMIRFGSQVDLVIPRLKDSKIKVRPGDEVKAGISVLIEYQDIRSTSE